MSAKTTVAGTPSDSHANRLDTEDKDGAANLVVAPHRQPLSSDTMTGLRLGYARVSTVGQVTDRQIDALEAAGVDRLYVDQGVSGRMMSRPQFDRLLDAAREGDTIVVHSLDRLGRRAGQMLVLLESLHARGISLRILTLDVDSRSPMGGLVIGVVAALAQAEAEITSARVREGLEAARARGRVGGRPPVLSEPQKAAVREMVDAGKTAAEVAAILGCSLRTIRRVLAVGS